MSAPPETAQPVKMRFCLILHARLRSLLLTEKMSQKRGKNRKLTKTDHEEVEQELQLHAFDPEKFLEQHMIGNLLRDEDEKEKAEEEPKKE